MKRITLYNHDTIGDDKKPLVTNAQFKNLCNFLRAGHVEALPYYLEKFTLVSGQISCANWIIEHNKK